MPTSPNPGGKLHVVVVGAGIVGSSIAFNLARRGAQVTVFDAGDPGQGATAASFAWINGRDKNPRHYHDLNRRSLDMWDRFARRLGGGVELTWGGELRWAGTQDGARALRDRAHLLQSWGYPIRLVERGEMDRLLPEFEPGTVAAASYSETDGHVNAGKVVRACLTLAQEQGAGVRARTKVSAFNLLQTDSGRARVGAVVTDEGEVPCDAVVLAVGPDTPALAALAGLQVQLRSTFGATIITEPLPSLLKEVAVVHTHHDINPQMAFRQLANGSLVIHGGLHGGSQDRSLGETDAEVGQVFQVAARLLPALGGVRVKDVRRGRRPLPVDGHPILGFAQAVPNLYLAAMHSGVTLAALVGEFAAMEIVDGARIDLLEPFRPERLSSPL